MLRLLLAVALLAYTAVVGVSAQMLMRRTDLVQVADCPIEQPYVPEPDRSGTTNDGESLTFAMTGYAYQRIQFSGLVAATELEIIWRPDNPYFPGKEPVPWRTPWSQRTAHLMVAAGSPQCFFNWLFSPRTVPGHIEIRARESLAGLKVSFSDRTWDHEGECPARQLCPVLVQSISRCRAAPG